MENIKMTKEELVDAMLDNRITFEFDYSVIKKKKRKKKASRDRTLEFLEKLKKVSFINCLLYSSPSPRDS